MEAQDSFTEHYQQLLEGTYECPDRIVVNGYFLMGHRPGPFRMWWRLLYGDDENVE